MDGKRDAPYNQRAVGRSAGIPNRTAVLLAIAFVASACSSAGESNRSSQEQCHDMVDTYCAKTAECAAPTDRTEWGQRCEFAFEVQLPCDRVSVQGNMDPCLSALDAVACGSFDPTKEALPWPGPCQGIIGLR